MIPKGWSKQKLGDIAIIERGKFSIRPRNDPRYYGGNIPFIQTGDVSNANGQISKWKQTLNELGLSVSRLFPKGTIFMTIAANIGDVAVADFDAACPDSVVGIIANEDIDSDWLFQQLIRMKDKLDSLSTQNAQKNINLQKLKPIQILVPSFLEQKKIANILKKWDEAISLTERLIEKKERYKKALMQRLLTGRLRFSEFSGQKWKEIKLKNICVIKKGEQLNKILLKTNGKFPALNGGIMPSGYTSKWNTEENTITISEGGNSCGYVNLISEKFWCGGHCYALNEVKIYNAFLYYVLKSQEINIMRLRVGSGLPNIQKKDIENFKIKISNILNEQEKIGEFFFKVDNKIRLLKEKFSNLNDQKNGLMKQLLTGKIRV